MIVIALGGNLPFDGNPPERTLRDALAALEERGDIKVTAVSRFYANPSWPDPSDPQYVNAVALAQTRLAPGALLARMQEVETRFGRVRDEHDRWSSRTLDLDLIDYDGKRIDLPQLTLPHPRAHQRAFVLLPLADVAPGWKGPDGASLNDLIDALPEADKAATIVLQPPNMP